MRLAIILGLAIVSLVVLLFLPPIHQDPQYHQFADQRTLFGIANFWNAATNLAFLLVAFAGLPSLWRREAFQQIWERMSYGVLLSGVAMVAFGSAYYHLSPDDATLFWDRLPMTIVFMALLATTIGERVSLRSGAWLLPVLLVIGIVSVLYWRSTGDLRMYGFVQFYPMLALPLLWLLFPARYSATGWLWGMAAFYGLAKLFELGDRQVAAVIATGGHPWKHLAGAAGVLCYVEGVRRRLAIKDSRPPL